MQDPWIFQTEGSPGGASYGNRVTLYRDGDEAFRAAYDAIVRARPPQCRRCRPGRHHYLQTAL